MSARGATSADPVDAVRATVVLAWCALAVVLVLTAALARPAAQDSGWSALVLLGVPVLCCAAGVVAAHSGPAGWSPALLLVSAALCLGWSLLTGLGLGLFLLLPSVLLLVAAAVSVSTRLDRSVSRGRGVTQPPGRGGR